MTVLPHTLDDYSHVDQTYINYMLSINTVDGVTNYEIVTIKNPIACMDEEGVIEYSINDGRYPDMKLHTRIIDIDGEKDFHWRGTTADKQNSLTLICRDYGVCGSIYLGETNTRIHIVPLTDSESVLILDT